MSQPHLGLPLVAEGSIYPEYRCKRCGEQLWTIKGERTGWREWLETKDGQRHYKNRCNLTREATDARD